MILIISEETDFTTDKVIDWIKYYGNEYIRINPTSPVNLEEIKITDEKEVSVKLSTHSGQTFMLENIKSYWYRRGRLKLNIPIDIDIDSIVPISTKKSILNHLDGEAFRIIQLIYWLLEQKKHLNTYDGSTVNINKLVCLTLAKQAGLKVPETLITTIKKKFTDFASQKENVITKAIGEGFNISINDISFGEATERIPMRFDSEKSYSEFFFPSLFQEEIIKEFEIRTFFLDKECFSMAIFSQADEQTKIDFRNYNHEIPNRNIPFKLPKDIEKKIVILMESMKLNSGSIDLIYTKTGDYIFLEVNPVGQFGMTNRPCNYFLHQKIAKYLIDD